MSNMSYCRFENTSNDMQDCLNAIENGEAEIADLNEYEQRGLLKMLECARLLVELESYGTFQELEPMPMAP